MPTTRSMAIVVVLGVVAFTTTLTQSACAGEPAAVKEIFASGSAECVDRSNRDLSEDITALAGPSPKWGPPRSGAG